jgi:GTP cyclohydrolase I
MKNDELIIRQIIKAIGDNPDREGLIDTPSRVVKSWNELFSGYREDPTIHLEKTFDSTSSQMISINGISLVSTCEHHMLPFTGTCDIAYIPKNRVVGLSKFARLVDGFSRRLQIQERLTNEIADAIESKVECLGVAVRIQAKHSCMSLRGAKNHSASMTTTALRGIFLTGGDARQEWLASLS